MNPARPKILVVDDTRANLVAMHHLLVDSGAELIEASSGNEALALCLDHHFALILLDVNMPDMDGFEVASLLGEADQLKNTPIIFVTAAYADDLNKLKGYHSGAVDYIAKPINDAILRSKVRVFLDLYNARLQLEHAMSELAERNRLLKAEIDERERAEAQVRHQATHDMLTGLPNRVLFHERLSAALDRCRGSASRFALVLLDIDGFKGVNDTWGHPAGDALLKAIAGRLRSHVREHDTIARLGGDEFALVVAEIGDETGLLMRCQELCDMLGRPYALQGLHGDLLAHVSASIGIAVSDDACSDEQLIQATDRALYKAKANGKNRCVLGLLDAV